MPLSGAIQFALYVALAVFVFVPVAAIVGISLGLRLEKYIQESENSHRRRRR